MITWFVVDIERITKEKQLFQLQLSEPFDPKNPGSLADAIAKQLSATLADLLCKSEITVSPVSYKIYGVYGGDEEGPDYSCGISAETYLRYIDDGADV